MVLQNINKNLFLLPLWPSFYSSLSSSSASAFFITANKTWHAFWPSKLHNTRMPSLYISGPTLAKFLINIATCCEGHKIEILAKNSLFFRRATSPCGCFLSFHITMLQLANISHQDQQFRAVLTAQAVLSTTCGGSTTLSLFLLARLLNAPTWQAARNAPHINVNSRAVPVMDASSDVLTTLSAVS